MFILDYFVKETECLPIGVWKNIELVQCMKSCHPLPEETGKVYVPEK